MTVAEQEQSTELVSKASPSAAKRVMQIVLTLLWTIGSLFLGAGTFRWTRGWICVGLWVLSLAVIGVVTERLNPQLMKERANWRRQDTKRFDKIFLFTYMPFVLLQPAIAGMDAVRFHGEWMSFPFAYAGAALYMLAMTLVGWVLAINPHAETSVRIQTDRGHIVIASGPYRFVRHPMYVGASLMYLSMPLVWGSLWALIDGFLITLLFAARTALEDRTLLDELPGYKEYAAHTRYRLIPGIW